RTHGAASEPAAGAHADAAQGGFGEASAVRRVLEVRAREGRPVQGAQAKVLVEAIRIDELAGIHASLRVPDRLELAESLDQLRPEHPRQQLRARLAVAVLAGERPAEAHDEKGRLLHEGAVGADPGPG